MKHRKTTNHNYLLLMLLLVSMTISSIIPLSANASSGSAGQGSDSMSLGQAEVLGIVEGLTEYLPVSSTGHLLLTERILGIGEFSQKATMGNEHTKDTIKDAMDAYTICIQAGAIIAVLGLYFGRVIQMLRGLVGRDAEGRRMLINIIAGFLPAAVIGLLFNGFIKEYLFGPWPVVAAWLAGGVAILAVSRRRKNQVNEIRKNWQLNELTWKLAIVIGFAQCLAMWPGVSRSLVTICGGLLVGLSMTAAVEYSFLLGVVTLSAATAYDVLKHGQVMIEIFNISALVIGLVFAFLAAIVSVKWMVSYLNRHGLALFGYYRIALSLVAGLLIVMRLI